MSFQLNFPALVLKGKVAIMILKALAVKSLVPKRRRSVFLRTYPPVDIEGFSDLVLVSHHDMNHVHFLPMSLPPEQCPKK